MGGKIMKRLVFDKKRPQRGIRMAFIQDWDISFRQTWQDDLLFPNLEYYIIPDDAKLEGS